MLLELRDLGLYCPAGDFYIDPWGAVPRAVLTHAHADHARFGSHAYLVAQPGEPVFRARLGDSVLQPVSYGARVDINGVQISLHPAGHLLGSAQVRIEHRGEVWVVSGDYKRASDSTCTPFEVVPCHTFITESTFGLPIFRWAPSEEVFAQINNWWRSNQAAGRASVLLGYALGKAQRLLSGLDPTIGPIYTHGAVERLVQAYRDAGVALPETSYAAAATTHDWSQAIILAPPSAQGTPWLRRFGDYATGLASGWMQVRGTRRRRAVDRGFVLSDHVDWPDLLDTIAATGAERVWVTHGYTAVVVRWLQEQSIEALAIQTRFEGEQSEAELEPEPESGKRKRHGD
ncbi:ligase-associated DNA damage response exonuclease [Candidatus Gracilibacteria bacterium]|nr:ligase-associated DNA damage response exonuclease [Candidatus Gracilibacteria bacterium]